MNVHDNHRVLFDGYPMVVYAGEEAWLFQPETLDTPLMTGAGPVSTVASGERLGEDAPELLRHVRRVGLCVTSEQTWGNVLSLLEARHSRVDELLLLDCDRADSPFGGAPSSPKP